MRDAGAGAANSGIRYLSDSVGLKPGWPRLDMGSLMGMAGRLIPPFGLLRDPRKGCGGVSPFAPILGYGSARGYRYDLPKTGGAGQKKFSLMEFLKETAVGGITGGVASAGFYGAGKGIEALKSSVSNVDIDSALSLKFESGDAKQRAALDEAMRIAGPSSDKEFKVFGHGNSNEIMFGEEPLNAEKVAYVIKNSPGYVGGKQKVILYACNTGKEPNGLAGQLANILGVIVEAPNTEIRPSKTGGFLIGDIIYKGGVYYLNRGKMKIFRPN